jgi:hypothetical protein
MMPKKYTKDFLLGKKFNALEYIEHTDTPLKYKTKKSQGMYCKWKCDCGNIIVYLASEVVKGRKKSCECYLYRRKDKHHNWTGCQDISGEYWLGIKNNAKTRKLKFEISIEDAWEIYIKQNKKCVITGIDLTFATSSNSHDGNASLDRIDSNVGYIKNNLQWVHKTINYIKRDLSDDEFIDWCRKVTMFQVLKN